MGRNADADTDGDPRRRKYAVGKTGRHSMSPRLFTHYALTPIPLLALRLLCFTFNGKSTLG